MSQPLKTKRSRILREERILDALTFALADGVISNVEERALWKSITYLMHDKSRVQKLKYILQKKFGTIREKQLLEIMLRYTKRVDTLNRMKHAIQ